MEKLYTVFCAALGWCGIVKGRAGVVRVLLPEPRRDMLEDRIHTLFPFCRLSENSFLRETAALMSYFSGNETRFSFARDVSRATPFQQEVWAATGTIPYGQVRTYGWVAEKIKKPGACRAVGSALARNPLPIIIPCHRIIRKNGRMGGFSAVTGTALKEKLLILEGINIHNVKGTL